MGVGKPIEPTLRVDLRFCFTQWQRSTIAEAKLTAPQGCQRHKFCGAAVIFFWKTKVLSHRSASASCVILGTFVHYFWSLQIMSLYETCLWLNVGSNACVVKYMITFTPIQMYNCLWHKCTKYVYMNTFVHTNALITHKHICSHIDINFHTCVEYWI